MYPISAADAACGVAEEADAEGEAPPRAAPVASCSAAVSARLAAPGATDGCPAQEAAPEIAAAVSSSRGEDAAPLFSPAPASKGIELPEAARAAAPKTITRCEPRGPLGLSPGERHVREAELLPARERVERHGDEGRPPLRRGRSVKESGAADAGDDSPVAGAAQEARRERDRRLQTRAVSITVEVVEACHVGKAVVVEEEGARVEAGSPDPRQASAFSVFGRRRQRREAVGLLNGEPSPDLLRRQGRNPGSLQGRADPEGELLGPKAGDGRFGCLHRGEGAESGRRRLSQRFSLGAKGRDGQDEPQGARRVGVREAMVLRDL